MEASLKVLIADDHPLMLQGIRRALEASEDIDVVGEARCGEELLALAERRKPDLVLLDVHMPGLNGLEPAVAFEPAAGRLDDPQPGRLLALFPVPHRAPSPAGGPRVLPASRVSTIII